MQTARIPKVHFIARARLDSLEMESLASVSDYQCSTDRLDDVFKKYYNCVKIIKDFTNHLLICYDSSVNNDDTNLSRDCSRLIYE